MVSYLNDVVKSLIIILIASYPLLALVEAINRGTGDNLSVAIVVIIAVFIAIVMGIIFYVIFSYNSLVGAKNNVENSWAQIDVQLKKRMDLIPNIVETVKGYAKHENKTFINVTKARSGLESATTVKDTVEANNILTNTLKSLFAVAEDYPELKANSNFQDLQNQLSAIEEEIANQRTVFNRFVLKYNNLCEQFPSNMVANKFNFKVIDYFRTEEESRNAPKVKF